MLDASLAPPAKFRQQRCWSSRVLRRGLKAGRLDGKVQQRIVSRRCVYWSGAGSRRGLFRRKGQAGQGVRRGPITCRHPSTISPVRDEISRERRHDDTYTLVANRHRILRGYILIGGSLSHHHGAGLGCRRVRDKRPQRSDEERHEHQLCYDPFADLPHSRKPRSVDDAMQRVNMR
jgi:hypothetical protein